MTLTVPSKFTTLVNDTDNDADVVEAIQTDLYNGLALTADYINDNMPLVSGNNTWTGTNTWSGATVFTNAASFSMQGVASRIVLASDQAVADITTAGLYFSSATNKPGIRFNGSVFQFSNDGTNFFPLGGGVLNVDTRTSNTVLGASDMGTLFLFNGTFNQTLTAAATLGENWYCFFQNISSGVVTLDPNASETVNGATTFAVPPGMSGMLVCDGTNFRALFTRPQYICLRDEKAQNTDAGTFTSGAWRTRDLNTKSTDETGGVTLAANQFTLPAGTYVINAYVPGLKVDNHQAKLYNTSDSSDVIMGTSVYAHASTAAESTLSTVNGRFTISASKTFEIQHQCLTTVSTDGFGRAANFGTEVYTVVELWKVA